ncbi:MAG: C40 family peptidase [Candidatus Sericytochromatia bacterium]
MMINRLFKTAGIIAILGVSLISSPSYATSSFQLFGQEVVLSASQHLGLPYIWGGEDPNRGFDCSGLIKYTFEEFNVELPHRADLQYNYGEPVKKDELQPGDIVFFSTGGYPIGHVGIYVGEGKFIHAPRRGRPISIDSITTGYFSARFVGARRITPDYF